MVMFVFLMIGLAALGAVLSGICDGRHEEARMLRFQPAVNPPRVAARQVSRISRSAYEVAAGDELMAEIEEWLTAQR